MSKKTQARYGDESNDIYNLSMFSLPLNFLILTYETIILHLNGMVDTI